VKTTGCLKKITIFSGLASSPVQGLRETLYGRMSTRSVQRAETDAQRCPDHERETYGDLVRLPGFQGNEETVPAAFDAQ
jgi:hypothetical protein